jgi:hypothetical protein
MKGKQFIVSTKRKTQANQQSEREINKKKSKGRREKRKKEMYVKLNQDIKQTERKIW